MFYNREDAGQQLAHSLKKYQNKNAIILAVPRGGVPIGKVVAKTLGLPLDIILTKKIGHPGNKEYAIGAVGLDGSYFTKEVDMIPEVYIEQEVENVRAALRHRYEQYMHKKTPLNLHNKTVIIVDDGIATGSTLLATIKIARKKGASSVIIAAPVAPPQAIKKLADAADEVVCLETHPDFNAVGQYYRHFDQVSDEEVSAMLND
ncbi:phosphoribosyltransferase [Fulvivirga sp. 29W222]|uniref:Phosphoribosyltransferase n=1 Tax=Fulvivirga marina TaxID=2494733 RepID=A0A937G3C2_9BACT|nr:phosphoribosyltransferase family protein [Fulvivirga marina]MBL6449235.1 phosphoribosyltransferase [Fulvivirga marina]